MSQQIFGWKSIEELSYDIWNSIHSNLLYGDFVFAARQSGYQIVISKRKDLQDNWMIGTMTPGWTSLQTRVCLEQLQQQVPEDLKNFKFDKSVITNFLELINNKNKNEYTSN